MWCFGILPSIMDCDFETCAFFILFCIIEFILLFKINIIYSFFIVCNFFVWNIETVPAERPQDRDPGLFCFWLFCFVICVVVFWFFFCIDNCIKDVCRNSSQSKSVIQAVKPCCGLLFSHSLRFTSHHQPMNPGNETVTHHDPWCIAMPSYKLLKDSSHKTQSSRITQMKSVAYRGCKVIFLNMWGTDCPRILYLLPSVDLSFSF